MQNKIKIGFTQAIGMIYPYFKKRLMEQIKAVWLIVLYLIIFQNLVLQIPIAQASVISFGIVFVIVGLTFFMEGLLLGLMPLGETIGIKLPQKSKLPVILIFSFILGVGATFAEPAVGVLKVAGSSVKAWDAPLLYLILNKYSDYLVYAVGVGVGTAVLFGMLRFLYSWSLKPFIYILVGLLSAITVGAFFEPNLIYVTGLAWDCGGVTTGPVTVPLVLALGIGITRIVSKDDSGGAGGFGVVTLASAFPVLTVMLLGAFYVNSVPKPMSDIEFFSPANKSKALFLFENENKMAGYILQNASMAAQNVYFENTQKMNDFLSKLASDKKAIESVFESEQNFNDWFSKKASQQQRLFVYQNFDKIKERLAVIETLSAQSLDMGGAIYRNFLMSVQAILPLSLFLFITLVVVLREKLKRADEIALGVAFAVIGMTIFSLGIELGLSKLGSQVGEKLPSSFKSIELTEQKQIINNFDSSIVQKAIAADGSKESFFYAKMDGEYKNISYQPSSLDQQTMQYTYTPVKKPIFGADGSLFGIGVVLIFGFIMGYGATLAEPALNALGMTVEELTVGAFKKSLLIQTVAIGVGAGIALGVAKIIWNIPLAYMLVPPYLLLLIITKFSSEDFVNIGWDSAGVTTGPITVPLVLAMGLGISSSVGVVEGFGILAMASVMPILAVLVMGIAKERQAQAAK